MTEENLPAIRASRRVEVDAAQPARMRSMLCRVGSAEDYAQQAATIAGQGTSATVAADDQWRPLGVFAMARKEDTSPGTFLSLAIDKKTQRAAWTIADKKTPVYEAGLSNLTQQQTTILMHRDGGKVEQMLLVRVQDPKQAAPAKP